MEDITAKSIDSIMKIAPVWATSLAGRTKVFLDPDCPTAVVSGGGGRFKIVVNPSLDNTVDLPFVIMHELAHIFRKDLKSMEKYPAMAQDINVAADCIINDSLVKIGIRKPSIAGNMCWGKDIYKMDCSSKSINELLKIKIDPSNYSMASAPSGVSEEGKSEEEQAEQGQKEEATGGVGADKYLNSHIGVGKDPIIHEDLKPMARSIAAYARRMFFEQGFKSKNLSVKNDWRRNRSAFASRNDIVIPRQTVGEAGNERQGPLINMVLDCSGSMDQSWVATAALIADEIHTAGLDFDLWITPVRRKAYNPRAYLKQMLEGGQRYEGLSETSFGGTMSHRHLDEDNLPRGVPSGAKKHPTYDNNQGADELEALSLFETLDPVVWIYIGDYHSRMDRELHFRPNFLHVPLVDNNPTGATKSCRKLMTDLGLPNWTYNMGKK